MIPKMIIGNKEFDIKNHTYVCGILNVTPDSFSDGGNFINRDKALFHVEQMIKDGAHIIDIGGESTRPGFVPISEDEEIERVCHVIEEVKRNFDIPVSIDTYKSKVFFYALKSGVDMLNDIWGLKHDEGMAKLVKDTQVALCIMHNKKDSIYGNNTKEEVLDGIERELKESIEIAKGVGIEDNRICIDPGIGFAKTYEMNLWVLNEMNRFKKLGYPLYIGASRKSVIGNTLNVKPEDRLNGTIATTVMAVMKGAAFVRVHDVLENAQAIKMTERVINS